MPNPKQRLAIMVLQHAAMPEQEVQTADNAENLGRKKRIARLLAARSAGKGPVVPPFVPTRPL